jgi:iron complex outermembrane recepter protein
MTIRARLGISASIAALLPAAAFAQTVTSAQPAPDAGISDIVVTAQRREERLQDVPVAVSAISGIELQRRGIADTQDLGAKVPGLSFQTAGISRPRIFIRGLGSIQSDANSDSSVGIFVDDVYLSGFGNFNLDLFDVSRIEVLRGPQGALFGRNTAGGAISVTTLKPTQAMTGQVEVSGGNFGQIGARGTISGAIFPDVLAARVSLSYRKRDGFTRDVTTGGLLNGADNVSGRVALEYTGIPGLTASASLTVTRDNPGPFNQENLTTALFQVPSALAPGFAPTPGVYDERYSTFGYQRRDSVLAMFRLDYAASFATLSSITAYQRYNLSELQDFDASLARSFDRGADEQHPAFSQEFRLASAGSAEARISWLAGAFYSKETPNRLETFFAGPDNSVARGPNRGQAFSFSDRSNLRVDSIAFYGQAKLRFSDWLSVTGGLRYSIDDKQNARTTTQSGFIGAANPNLPGGPYSIVTKASFHSLDPTVSINLQPMRDLLIYGSYRQGFKSGGFQPANAGTIAIANAIFSPERVKSFEVGVKTTLLDRRLRLNVAAFDNKYENLQLLSGNAATPGSIAVINNAASANARGVEIELAARPFQNFDIDVSYAYIDAKFDMFLEAVTGPAGTTLFDRTGKRLPRQPESSLNIGAQYAFDIGSAGKLALRGDWNRQSTTYFDASNAVPFVQPGYSLLNLRASFTTNDGHWQFAVFGKNVGDTRYITNTTSLAGATVGLATYSVPRTFGASISYSFGN